MRALVLASVLVALLLAPGAHAETSRSWGLTSLSNEATGTFVLSADTRGGDNVDLPADAPVTWADPNALLAAAPFTDGDFAFDLHLSRAVGSLTVRFGFFKDGAFTELASSGPVAVQPATRTVLDPVGTTGTVLDVGQAVGTIEGVDAVYPAGSHPAIQIESTDPNSLYTADTLLGAQSQSSASVPLPELPAAALFAVGAAAVVGLAAFRARKGWN